MFGGGQNPQKIFEIYTKRKGERVSLLERLKNDITYKGEIDIIELPKEFIDAEYDPSGTNKYLDWIVMSYVLGGIRFFEDLYKVKVALKDYEQLKKTKKIRGDIFDYCGLNGCKEKKGLYDLLKDFEQHEDIEYDQSSLLFSNENVSIYIPKTFEESEKYGKGTKWCTSSSPTNFENYYKKGPLFILIPTKKIRTHQTEKYQIHYETNSFMNELDKPVDISNLLKKFPEELKLTARNLESAIFIKDIPIIMKYKDDISKNKDKNYLDIAIKTGNIDIIKMIIDFGCNITTDNSFDNAISTGNIDIIKMIIAFGCKPTDNSFYFAITTNKEEIIQFLLEEYKNISKGKYNLIDYLDLESIDSVRLAIKYGGIKPNKYTIAQVIRTGNHELYKCIIDNFGKIDGSKYNTLRELFNDYIEYDIKPIKLALETDSYIIDITTIYNVFNYSQNSIKHLFPIFNLIIDKIFIRDLKYELNTILENLIQMCYAFAKSYSYNSEWNIHTYYIEKFIKDYNPRIDCDILAKALHTHREIIKLICSYKPVCNSKTKVTNIFNYAIDEFYYDEDEVKNEIFEILIDYGYFGDKNTPTLALKLLGKDSFCFKLIKTYHILYDSEKHNTYNKYRTSCLKLDVNELKKIISDVDIKEINSIKIDDLTKKDICLFLDSKYELSNVLFNKK